MSDRGRVVITGRGVLSPLGCDWETFAAAVRSGTAAPVAPFASAVADGPVLHHPLSDPDLVQIGGSGRDSEPLSELATAAAWAALVDADVAIGDERVDDVGLVMNTAFGPSMALETYLGRLYERGPRSARPALFVDTLISMPASRVGIALGLRGSAAVLSGSSALELAFDWVRQGREHTVVAGGGEFLSPKCLRFHRELAARSGAERAHLAQAAAFVVLEEHDRALARGVDAFAEVLGAGAASEPQEVALPWPAGPEGGAFACAMRSALAEAAVLPEEVGCVALAAGDGAAEASEMAAVRAVFKETPKLLRSKRLLGEGLGASAGLSMLATLASLEQEKGASSAALVNSFEMGGAVSSLALRVTPV